MEDPCKSLFMSSDGDVFASRFMLHLTPKLQAQSLWCSHLCSDISSVLKVTFMAVRRLFALICVACTVLFFYFLFFLEMNLALTYWEK